MKDVVIGLDSSTTATKAIAWDASGTPLAEGRAAVPMQNPRPGYYEQDPQDWWRAAQAALRQLWNTVEPERVAALSTGNQRETVAFLDAQGQSVRPAILWLDERCHDEVAWLSDKLGKDLLHRTTGRPPDVTTGVYSLAWMLRHEAELYKRVDTFLSVHGYLVKCLTGQAKTSWASAGPLGVFDIQTHDWSADILEALELSPTQFAEAHPPASVLGETNAEAAQATGLLPGTPIVAGGGDGQCAGLGLNTTQPGRAYLNLGTAVVSGVYSERCKIDPAFRTLIACADQGYILETLLRSGTFLLTWFVASFLGQDPNQDNVDWQGLERAASQVPLGSEGLLLVPHWMGCMTPHWDSGARGVLLGLSGNHKRPQIYRALLEGIALEQALMTSGVEATGASVDEIVLTGGGAQSALWRQIIADALGKPVRVPRSTEATTLGAAILAAVGAGWFSSVKRAADTMTHVVETVEPDMDNHERYQTLLAIHRKIYPQIHELNASLAAFRQ